VEDDGQIRERAAAMRPPVVADGEPVMRIKLSGGAFGEEGQEFEFPMSPDSASWQRTANGLNLSIAPPDFARSKGAPMWGVWLFLDGPIREGATLRFRTGSQIVIDGVSHAPVSVPNSPPSRNNHVLEGGLQIAYLDVNTRFIEGRLRSSLLPPGGGDPVALKAGLQIQLDSGR